jgi:hypothetical protein
MSMEGLRQGANSARSNRNNGNGRKGSAYFARLKPPQMLDELKPFLAAPPNEEAITQIAEPIVLIKGEYVDEYARDVNGNPVSPPVVIEAKRFKNHTVSVFIPPKSPGQKGIQSFRDITCSAGPESHAPQPCVGCYQVDHGAKDSKPRDQWAFNIAHLAWYHQHPLVKDGQVQTKKGSSDPILVKGECLAYKKENELLGRAVPKLGNKIKQPKTCENCGQQHPFVFGDHRVLQLGSGHLKALLGLNDDLKKKCANCNTNLVRSAFRCGNEACDVHLVDVAAGMQGWTTDQIEQFEKTPQTCGSCTQTTLPFCEYVCGYDDSYNLGTGCGDARPMEVWDCVIWVQREGKGTESELKIKRIEPISKFKTPDNRPLSEHLKEIVKEPFDLVDMYKSKSLDDQASEIRVPNPYVAQAPQYQSYGQQGFPAVPGQQQPAYGPPGVPAGAPAAYPNMPTPGRPNFGK